MFTKLQKQTAYFYLIILREIILLPVLLLIEELKKLISDTNSLSIKKKRHRINPKKVKVVIHEWGGYPARRKKKINIIPEFECGLQYQLQRFTKSEGIEKQVFVTISDIDKIKDLQEIETNCDEIISVSNDGMDFSGYAAFYDRIKNLPDSYVILTNSSVNSIQTEFLQSYLNYMDNNLDVGVLGVSYSGKMRQTLIRNNFTPHLQSFFLLTTQSVLKEIVESNKGKFVGKGILHKLLLIREGEIKLSKLAQKIGYNLAVTQENGEVFKFGRNSSFDNGFKRWKLYYDDVRLIVKNPNIINVIKQ